MSSTTPAGEPRLDGRRIAFLATDGVEQVELTEPWRAVRESGAVPSLISLDREPVHAFDHLDRAGSFAVDNTVLNAHVDDYDALVLPGGVANPDRLRTDEQAVAFVRAFVDAGKPVAVICHGPWTLLEAGAVRGRTLTSWPSLKTDLRNAGAHWVDQDVVVCEAGEATIVSSRKPADLPAFCETLVERFAEVFVG